MVRRLLPITLALLVAPSVAQAKTFEQALKKARGVTRLSQVIGPFLQRCGQGASLRDIQCRAIRSRMQYRVRRTTFRTTVPAVRVGKYDNARLRFPVSVVGCLTCARAARLDPALYGKQKWYVTTGRPARFGVKGGRPEFGGIELAKIPQPVGPSQVETWMKTVVPNLKVQMIYRVDGTRWAQGSAKGLAVKLVGFRLFNQCTGQVLASKPPSAGRASVHRSASCGVPARRVAARVAPRRRALPSRLGPHDILRGMKRLDALVQQCYDQYQVPGLAEVKVSVLGKTGRIATVKVLGKFRGSPTTGTCLRNAVKKARFPLFRARKMVFRYRWYLR